MNTIYLDNAATTPILPEVIEVMQKSMQDNFGNPSSIHQYGRRAKVAVETARKNIAKRFNVSANEIVFTAGGTEADNLILFNAVNNLGVKRIVTSKIEHHAVLHTVQYIQEKYNIEVVYVALNEFGVVDIEDLEQILIDSETKTLVSLMYVNNEIGNLLPIDKVSELCKNYQALFHSDTVQAVGHYSIDLQKTPIDFMVASAHKFHGPKGVGFAYCRKGIEIQPMLHGGEQERGVRSSTENVHAILGMEKALELSYVDLEKDKDKITSLKVYFIEELKKMFSSIAFNGCSSDLGESSYSILNVRFPVKDKMLLFNLDLSGIAVSGGSACQSGSSIGSHVLNAFLAKNKTEEISIRFSFSKFNTIDELNIVLTAFRKII